MGPQAPSGFNYTQHNCNTSRRPLGWGCGKRTLVGLVDGHYHHRRFRCKSYHCARCGPRKIRQVRKRIVQLAIEHRLRRFLTLTLDPQKLPSGLDTAGKIRYLQKTWRKMRVYLTRRLGRSLAFIAVVELQENGNPHLHLLVGSYLPKQWISSAWQSLGGGWATRIQCADLHRVAAYLAKYVTDDSLRDLPRRTRRFSASKGLALFDRSKGDGAWLLLKTTIEILRESALAVISEEYETEPDGARSLAAFTAGQAPAHLAERLSKPVERRRT